jgi:hypothetical protein
VATRFIIAKLRNRQFFSLAALNVAIAEQVARINDRVSRHLGTSRCQRPVCGTAIADVDR